MKKFNRYDLVQIAADLGPTMSHFTHSARAIVLGSDEDSGGILDIDELDEEDVDEEIEPGYELYIENCGESAWYPESTLTLMAPKQRELLKAWRKADREYQRTRSSSTWIFEHGKEVLDELRNHKGPYSHPSLEALLYPLGGSEGTLVRTRSVPEGIESTYIDTEAMLGLAEPFLMAQDRAGWIALCRDFQAHPDRYSIFKTYVIP